MYRALDSDVPGVPGPLQELLARIGGQVAVARRSIDRLWADQSIETCDDWVIPYIGDLLGTRLVSDDPRGQRLEVAKTIHYRRRKGTLAVLEEIARDVTGWQAHVVEGFRRIGRTRHRLDPPVGPAPLDAALPTPCGPGTAADQGQTAQLLAHEGLVGALTQTPVGGLADLRSAHGATLADSAFDEYFHSVDVRSGRGSTGWDGIPKLLVFLWRLQSFAVAGGTPVPVSGSTGEFVFDPTGRRIPLFLPPLGPEPDDWVDAWTPPAEWQVPGPLSNSLARAVVDPGGPTPPHPPYPDAAEIPAFAAAATASSGEPIPIVVTPESGEFTVTAEGQTLTVDYQYGMPSPIGAGPYDRSVQTDPPPLVGNEATVAGGSGLDQALTDAAGSGTVTITDSQTYGAVDVGSSDVPIASILIRAGNQVRPVVRLPGAATPTDPPVAWVFTGGAADSELTLDGLLISGGDIVLRGGFASVRITACTADPGTLDSTLALAVSADERPLAPVRIWIEADPTAAPGASPAIASMEIDNCILGPVRTRNGGAVEAVSVSDSIVQGIAPAPADPGPLSSADVYDPELLAQSLAADDPVAVAVTAALTAAGQTAATTAITGYAGGAPSASALAAIVGGLGDILSGPSLYSPGAFLNVPLPPDLWAMLDSAETVEPGVLNLALLRAAFPVALSPAALAISGATLSLARVSVIGRDVRASPSGRRLDPRRVHGRGGPPAWVRPLHGVLGEKLSSGDLPVAHDRRRRCTVRFDQLRRAGVRAAARGGRRRDRSRDRGRPGPTAIDHGGRPERI